MESTEYRLSVRDSSGDHVTSLSRVTAESDVQALLKFVSLTYMYPPLTSVTVKWEDAEGITMDRLEETCIEPTRRDDDFGRWEIIGGYELAPDRYLHVDHDGDT